MARYILIDNASGYIFGDTADLPRHTFAGEEWPVEQSSLTLVDAARWLDEAVIGEFGRQYEQVGLHALASNESGYHLYRADVGGSDAVPVVTDGEDQGVIDEVIEHCEYAGTVRCSRTED